MELSFNKIKEIVTGAARIEKYGGAIKLYRFTKEQEALYKKTSPNFYMKSLSSAGIKLMFKTDSKTLFLKIATAEGSSRKYFSVDLFADGKPLDFLDNFSGIVLPQDYTRLEYPLGIFSKSFQLGEGEKNICVHLPWSAATSIEQIAVDDNAFVEGIKPKKKLLSYGDSITQGYDALRPSNRYTARLAEKLDAEEYNKAIGGERFFPELSELKDPFIPDYITVAYGTNDWSNKEEEVFKADCKAFYANISRNYPQAKIFAITPIWRKDMNEERLFGPFEKVKEDIEDVVKDFDNITVVPGFDLIPQSEEYYGDLMLHPNDEGFEYYFKNLFDKIKFKL